MRKSPASGVARAIRVVLLAALATGGGLGCAKTTQPIPKSDGGAGSGGGSVDAPQDTPVVTPDGATDGTGTGGSTGSVTNGKVCARDGECASGHCTEGVCCDTACTGTCWTCAAQGSVGACIPADLGTDPRNQCADEGVASCGNDGTCDGAGACRRYPTGTTCRQAACSGATLTLASRCEAGVCKPISGYSCDPYVCDARSGNVCLGTCTTNADCTGGNVCTNGRCGKTPIGGSCATADDCNSGFCQQGVCCRELCTGNCQSCAVPGSAGACTPVPAGTDPLGHCAESARETCGTDGFCDGMGGCEKYSKATTCKDPACPTTTANGTAAGKCDGMGTCINGAGVSCGAYMCGANGTCLLSCRTTADCSGGNVCNGTVCGRKVLGATCTDGIECASGTCQQGVCCDMVCTASCMACNQAASLGRCTPLPQGLAPAGQCPATDVTTCGIDGSCDGAGHCRLHPTGTSCKPQTCASAALTLAGRCNGAGVCVAGTMQPCAPYQCNGNVCLSTCSTANGNADCTTGNTCIAGSCGKKPLGTACGQASECGSAFCEQGVCCDMACQGTCKSCALTGSAGKCSNVSAGDDPLDQCAIDLASTCQRDGFCDGAGACRKYVAGTQCQAGSCAGSQLTLPRTCDGAGVCAPAMTSTCPGSFACDAAAGVCKTSCTPATTTADCVSPASCSGTACVLKGLGTTCGAANECASGFCEQGVCCGSSCTGSLCKSCALPGATLGTCSNIPAGQPDVGTPNRCVASAVSTCGNDGTCDGAGACRNYVSGTQCVAGSCPVNTSVQTPPRLCDGLGHCNTVTTVRCDPFLCDGSLACKTSCTPATSAADCLAPNTCNGTVCGKKQNGVACSINDECNSGACSQNVCCDRDCSGTCLSCNQTGRVGTCSPVPAGTVPVVASQCPVAAVSTCGNDGTCNGSGVCRLFASGTTCVAGSCSTGATLVQPRLCNGGGTCQTSATVTCAGGFNCNTGTNVCRTTCTIPTQATDCASPNVCTGNICGTIRLQYKAADTNANSSSPHPHFNLINLTATPVTLSELTIRYWFTGDGAQTYSGVIDFAATSANVQIQQQMTATFVAVTRTGANQYMQLGFNAGTGTLTNVAGTVVQTRFNSTNPAFGVVFNQTNDYSFDATKTANTDWTHVTLYRNGTLIWGIEPP